MAVATNGFDLDEIKARMAQEQNGTPIVRLPNHRDTMTPGKTPFTINMGGRERRLRLDFYAMSRLEDATGEQDLGHGGLRRYVDMTTVTFKQMNQFIWCMCLADDPSLDTEDPRDGIREVGHWFDVIDMYETYAKALETAAAAMPDIDDSRAPEPEADPKAKPRRKKGTGS